LLAVLAQEWPTLAVAGAIYGGWIALTWWYDALPTIVIVAVGAWLIAWHGSLQHETIHGHPTRSARINAMIGGVPLSLWLPYAIYHRSHVAHHACQQITDPIDDPESRYLESGAGPWSWLAHAQATLLGRLALGPALAVFALARSEASRLARSPQSFARDWLAHLAAVLPLIVWLEWTGFGLGRYLVLVVYPGTALTLLRSFAEHRADLPGPSRAATVERGGALALLYLNNNLHIAHHDRPDLAWYRLPAYQRQHRARLDAQAGRTYRNYGEIIRKFAFRPHDTVSHPSRSQFE
jgi:fatty acid desaturase